MSDDLKAWLKPKPTEPKPQIKLDTAAKLLTLASKRGKP